MEGSFSNYTKAAELLPCPNPSQRTSKRARDSVTTYSVQYDHCSKWRFIPTEERYEKIRETIMEQPFLCETARELRPEIMCDDEPDLVKDGSWQWAIDNPCIPQPPPGWQGFYKSEQDEA